MYFTAVAAAFYAVSSYWYNNKYRNTDINIAIGELSVALMDQVDKTSIPEKIITFYGSLNSQALYKSILELDDLKSWPDNDIPYRYIPHHYYILLAIAALGVAEEIGFDKIKNWLYYYSLRVECNLSRDLDERNIFKMIELYGCDVVPLLKERDVDFNQLDKLEINRVIELYGEDIILAFKEVGFDTKCCDLQMSGASSEANGDIIDAV